MIAAVILFTLICNNKVFASDISKVPENESVQQDIYEKEQSFELILKEGTTVEQFKKVVKRLYPDVVISSVPEILLIHITLSDSIDKNDFLNNKEIKELIYVHGELPEISAPRNLLRTVNLNRSNLPEINQLKKRMTNEELFDAMAWHVDEVTSYRKSLDISQGDGVKIALIDSGVDTTHPILEGKINLSDSCSYVDGDSSIIDSNGHGTSVAGVIAQVAPEAEMTVYRVIGEDTGESEWTVEAIIQAVNDGNSLINMSLGTYKCEDIESELLTIEAFERAIEYAENRDCLVVASSGNKSLDLDSHYETEHIKHLPGGIEGTITISAINNNSLASYSNYGSNIDLCAPGGDIVYTEGLLDLNEWIYCLYPTGMNNGLEALGVPQGYTFNCGTSLAAPAVTAGLADILSYYVQNGQTVSMDQVIEDMIKGAVDIGLAGKDTYFGYGSINIFNSLNNLN